MSTNLEARAWVEVDADALRDNLAAVRRSAGPGAGVLPMVKADAYGLGVERVVAVLEPLGPAGYGVATVSEGLDLRRLGIDRPVLVCAPTPPCEVGEAVEGRLELSISSVDALRRVAAEADRLGTRARVHVDVDTGMGRSGFDPARVGEWLPALRGAAAGPVDWVGCMTHLHSADEGPETVAEQTRRFEAVLDAIGETASDLVVHVLNSPGVFRAPEQARSLVRPGIFLYGGRVGEDQPSPRPVVRVRARVVHIREPAEGATLGYGATYRAGRDERWATLAIGYGDGLPRALGNGGGALLRGRRTPVVGRISMDVTVVDISGVPGVDVGDVATLVGRDGDADIPLDEVARRAGTISYEVLTGLTARLPRIWKDEAVSAHG